MKRYQKFGNEPKIEIISKSLTILVKPVIPIKEEKTDLETILDDLAFCESSNDNSKIGKAGEIGIFQYKKSTWNWFNKIRGIDLDIYSSEDQRFMTKWAWESGYKNHWTCTKIVLAKK